MTSANVLLRDVRDALLSELRPLAQRNDIEEAFAAWLLGPVHGLSLTEPARVAATREGAQRTYRECAILGFAFGALDNAHMDVLRSSLLIVGGREPFLNGQPMPYCSDAVSLLGVALGAHSVGNQPEQSIQAWMQKFVAFTRDMPGLEPWERCLLAAATQLLKTPTHVPWPQETDTADVRLAMRAKGLLVDAAGDESDSSEALKSLKGSLGTVRSPVRAALALTALDWIARCSPTVQPGRVSIDEVAELLRRVEPGLRRWTWEASPRTKGATARHWHIDNEYHVQNLLFAVLRTVFPDIDDEDYTKKVGPKQPRADLCVPSLRLVIEVKFWRRGDPATKIVGEISEDAGLYLVAGSDYSHVLPFVWDDAGRGDEHDRLVAGLSALPGVVDAVVISRPARFA